MPETHPSSNPLLMSEAPYKILSLMMSRIMDVVHSIPLVIDIDLSIFNRSGNHTFLFFLSFLVSILSVLKSIKITKEDININVAAIDRKNIISSMMSCYHCILSRIGYLLKTSSLSQNYF
jgi:hypothetical protein